MKTTGLFNNCIVTSKGAFFCGETNQGDLIYADDRDVERGFKMFTKYKVDVDDSRKELIPFHGDHLCASISRTPELLQIPEWLRFSKLLALMSKSNEVSRPAVARLEKITNISRLQSVVHNYPSVQVS